MHSEGGGVYIDIIKHFCFLRLIFTGTLLGNGVLKICRKFTGERPCRSVISIKLQSNFIEITLRHKFSPVTLLHIFRTPFIKNTSGWLLQRHLRTDTILDGIFLFIHTRNPTFTPCYFFPIKSYRTWKVNLYCCEKAIKFCFTHCKKVYLRTHKFW